MSSASPETGTDGSATPESDKLLAGKKSEEFPAREEIKKKRDLEDLKLKRRVGNGALGVMLLQILIADVVFVIYGFGNDWHIPGTAVVGWLSATVVEVIGVVVVITNYLFPGGGAFKD